MTEVAVISLAGVVFSRSPGTHLPIDDQDSLKRITGVTRSR